jgi:ADP-dependent NAD(P)H-hydrate dehydratase / NAD(P)H-hydrate epimerase
MIDTSQWILTAARQHALDDATVQVGLREEALMESAGTQAAEWITSSWRPATVTILAGPGGNGGDALVAARSLHAVGIEVQVFLWKRRTACAPQTLRMARRLEDAGILVHEQETHPTECANALHQSDVVVDGLLGSGLSRPIEGHDVELIGAVLTAHRFTVSLDVPSGVSSDSGRRLGPAVRADATLAMGFYKPCHWLYPAASHCGAVHCLTLPYPQEVLSRTEPIARVCDRESIQAFLPERPPNGHKGTFGRVLVIAGSRGMTGAAILCVRGALRAGAGLVTLALPRSLASTVQAAVPEALTVSLPDRQGQLVDERLMETLAPHLPSADVLAIGPGLGRNPRTLALVRRLLASSSSPVVIDADAVHALVEHPQLLTSLSDRAVLTPHPGEMAALITSDAETVDAHRLETAAQFSLRGGPTLVLKGRPTVIALAGGTLYVNPTGNTGLASGGSGDVLTGFLAGLIAGGSRLEEAARAAPYLHGLAADRWSRCRAQRSMTPSDLLEELPFTLREVTT